MAKMTAPSNGTTTRTAPIATRARARGMMPLFGYLPNPNQILEKAGRGIEALRELLNDAQVSGAVKIRKAATMKLEWQLTKDGVTDERSTAVIEDLLKNRLNLRRLISDILNAPLYGYQPIEVVWDFTTGPDGAEYLLPRIVEAKPPEWFRFDDENQLRFLNRDGGNLGEGELLPQYSFLLPRNDPSYENPYGEPVLGCCYWPREIKRTAIRFLLQFAERFGFPWVWAEYPDTYQEKEVAEVVDALDGLNQDAVGAFKQGINVRVEANGQSGSTAIFRETIDLSNAEISKSILYHGSSMDSTAGKLGNEDMAEDTSEQRAASDKQLVEDTVNQLIDWIYERNFPTVTKRVRFSLYEEEDVDKALAERDAILHGQGVRFTASYYKKAYGLAEGDFTVTEAAPSPLGTPAGAPAGALQFAEPVKTGFADQDVTDAIVGNLAPEQLQYQMEQMLAPVFAHIAGATDFSEAMEGLAELFPAMNTQDLMAVMERVNFVAETVGRAAAETGAE